MPFRRYLALTFAGAVVWNAALIFAGQQLGSRWSDVGAVVGPVAQWVLVASVPLVVAGLLIRARVKRRRG
jgi:membrane protein DedA with SNARE-associated domain